MSYLVLARHGISEYNKKGLWCGWIDPDLAAEGIEEAKRAGEAIKDIPFDHAYSNVLRRCRQTLDEIKKVIGKETLPTTLAWELNERNYGDYTNKNKWQVKEEVGEEIFQKIRRSWDYPIPSGESLKQVYARTVPYYTTEVEPKIKQGQNILITSSHNALRSLVKYLENVPDDKIPSLEIGTGEVYVYQMDENAKMKSKEIRSANVNKGKV